MPVNMTPILVNRERELVSRMSIGFDKLIMVLTPKTRDKKGQNVYLVSYIHYILM